MSSYPPIDPEFKTKWLRALRSGDYAQGYGALAVYGREHDDDIAGGRPVEFCCLGVACDLIDPKGWRNPPERTLVGGPKWQNFSPYTTAGLPFLPGSAAAKLAEMNDAGKSFSLIADWIEENL